MSDEEFLQSLLRSATADLRAPEARPLRRPAVVTMPGRPAPDRPPARRERRRRVLIAVVAAAAGAAAALAATVGFGTPTRPALHPVASVLYRLAAQVKTLPAPTGRYAVQIEQQSEQSSTYLKATVIDSLTGDTWTYQKGPGVPAVLPMAPGFSPTEAALQKADPLDPARLRAALIAQARARSAPAGQTPTDLAVMQAINLLWNPLVQPALRSALVSVIASSPGVTTDAHATDSRGRPAIEISYDDTGLGVRLSVYLQPGTGMVLENSERPYTATADRSLAGSDVYLSQYWTDASPATDPLGG